MFYNEFYNAPWKEVKNWSKEKNYVVTTMAVQDVQKLIWKMIGIQFFCRLYIQLNAKRIVFTITNTRQKGFSE